MALAIVVSGCTMAPSGKDAPSLKPGSASMTREGGRIEQRVDQSENPAQSTQQTFKRVEERKETVPPGSTIRTMQGPVGQATNQLLEEIVISLPMAREVKTVEESGTTIGAAQDDVATRGIWARAAGKAAETAAFIKAHSPLMLAGVVGLLLLAFSFTPYGRAMGLSKEGKLLLGGASLFCLISPAVNLAIRENGWLIVLGLVAVAGLWYLKERKEAYKTEAAKLQGFIDANKDGIDDRTQ